MSVKQKTDAKKKKQVALSCTAPKERETSGQERWQGMKARGDKTGPELDPRFYVVEGKN